MSVTREEAINIAHLACLNFSNTELDKITIDLNHVLEYMKKLDELDTTDVDLWSNSYNLSNAYRDDKREASLIKEDVFLNAPMSKDNYFQVPKVIKNG